VASLFRQKLNLLAKSANLSPIGRLRGNAHCSSMALVDWRWLNVFRQLSRLRRYERILVEIVVFERGWVTLSANFSGYGAYPSNRTTNHPQKGRGYGHVTVLKFCHLPWCSASCRFVSDSWATCLNFGPIMRGISEAIHLKFHVLIDTQEY